jgi:hypothetical protein
MGFQAPAERLRAAFLTRVARDPARETFVLRGGARIRRLLTMRRVGDLDLVCDEPSEAVTAIARILDDRSIGDGVTFDRYRLDAYDRQSPRPGLRLVAAGALPDGELGELVVDVVFGLPLWPAARWEPLDGGALRMVVPSTIIGTKLRVIAELGPRGWRPKDLADVLLLLRRAPAPTRELGAAIERESARSIEELLRSIPSWNSPRAVARWRAFARESPELEVPALGAAIDELRDRLAPFWRRQR